MVEPKRAARDISRVIDFLLSNVIPQDQTELREELLTLYGDTVLQPPEQQPRYWGHLAEILEENVGNPAGIAWAERTERILSDKEVIPNEYVETGRHSYHEADQSRRGRPE